MQNPLNPAKSLDPTGSRLSNECGIEGVLVDGSLRLVVYGKLHAKAASDLGSMLDTLGTINSKRVTVELADRSFFAPYARRWLQRRYERAQAAAFATARPAADLGEATLADTAIPAVLQTSSGI